MPEAGHILASACSRKVPLLGQDRCFPNSNNDFGQRVPYRCSLVTLWWSVQFVHNPGELNRLCGRRPGDHFIKSPNLERRSPILAIRIVCSSWLYLKVTCHKYRYTPET